MTGFFTAAWATPVSAAVLPGFVGMTIPKVFHFSAAEIAADIKFWMQQSLEGWYHFVGTVFESMINLILYTPQVLIHNPQVQMLWMIFVSITIGLLTVLCLVEGIKTVLGHSHTNFMQFVGRTVTAFAGISIILPAMTIGLDFINQFVSFFTDIAFKHVKASEFIGHAMGDTFANGTLGFVFSLLFLILFLYYMLRILLNYGRRWFDIILSAIVSPMAIGATIFDSTSHYFQKWWSHVLQLYMVQVIHAVYITVLAVVVLTPGIFTAAIPGMMKILIVIGALWRMSVPPKFISGSTGMGSKDLLKDITKKLIRNKIGKGVRK